MRLQAKYAGEFRTVRIPDELWSLWEVLEENPKQAIRDLLEGINGQPTSTASEAAKALITGSLRHCVKTYVKDYR